MKKRRQTRIKRKRMRTGRNKNRNKDRNKNRNGIKKQKNQNWMNPSSKIYNKINKVSEMVRVFCKPLDLYLAAHFPSLKQIEKQINTIEVSHSRCLWCQKEMEECFDARWIFFADQSLCQECQDKIFKKNKPDWIKIHQVLKQKGWTQRRKSSKRKKHSDKFYFRQDLSLSDQEESGPLSLFEKTEDLQSMYEQFTFLNDRVLNRCFLEHEQNLIKELKHCAIYTLEIMDSKWLSKGYAPISEIFRSQNCFVFPLLIMDERNQIVPASHIQKVKPKQKANHGRLNKKTEAIRKHRQTEKIKKTRITVFLTEPDISRQDLDLRMNLVDQFFDDIKPDLIITLF